MNQVRVAAASDIQPCADVLAAAFQDDPGTLVFEPDDNRRRTILPRFFSAIVGASMSDGGEVLVVGEPIDGVAIWFGPDRHGPSEEQLASHGLDDVLDSMGNEASKRLLAMVGELDRQHELLTAGPHMRLEFLGVKPGRQGQGIGGALIDHGHNKADALGLDCYLETFTQQNVRYYEHRGYRLAGTYEVGGDVPVFALIRPPQRTQGV